MGPEQYCFQQSRFRCHSTKVYPANNESTRSQASSHLYSSIRRREKRLAVPCSPTISVRNLSSRPPPTPTWSQNNIQVRIASSNPCIYILILVGSDSIVAASMTSSARRERGYCRQWIRHSACASSRVG